MNTSVTEAWSEQCEPVDAVLLSPPYTFPPIASVALSIFQVRLREAGITSRVIYPMFLFTDLLGFSETAMVSGMNRNTVYEEYLFAHLTGVENPHEPEEAVELLNGYRKEKVGSYVELLRKGRKAAEEVVEATAKRIVGMNPGVLACSMIYSQINGGLAICRRVRQLNPEIRIVIGGTVSGETGIRILKDYPFVDYVSFGEGDETIAETCEILLGRKKGPMPYGVVSASEAETIQEIPHPLTRDMNTVPMPDYADYLEEVRKVENGFYRNNFYAEADVYGNNTLFLEGSRGCWWGQKHPCSFCGLNGLKNVFRHKEPERIYREIHDLTQQHPGIIIQLTDNILDAAFMKGVLPKLKEDGQKYNLFAEVKSNLSDQDVKDLCDAGISRLQPGIESLNDHLLQLMGKGNTAVNHVALLRQCAKFGAFPSWNILYGVPGENRQDYQELLALIPKLSHLPSPSSCGRILFQRFSRYTLHPEEYHLKFVPWLGTALQFGDDPDRIREMAFNFDPVDCEFAEIYEANKDLYQQLIDACDEWRRLESEKKKPRLTSWDKDGAVMIRDSRPIADSEALALSGIHGDLYRLLDRPVTPAFISSQLKEKYGADEIKEALGELEELSLAVFLSGRWLALAVRED